MYSKRKTSLCFALMLGLTLICAAPSYAAKGGVPGPPGGTGEDTANNLSFPVVFTEGPGVTIPSDTAQGAYSLLGAYYLWDGMNPPCVPGETGCDLNAPWRVYVQKDPNNDWQAFSSSGEVTASVSHIDVGDNLESVPWRTTSPVRVEFVPFGISAMTGFEMVFVSGQGLDEVWGAKASNAAPPVANPYAPGFATLFSNTMKLSFTKLEIGSGSLSILPNAAAYMWDPTQKAWLIASDGSPAPHTTRVDFTAEINVKGRVIYGYNWRVANMVITNPAVTKDGWWRLTFYSTSATSPLDFTATTFKYDPIAGENVEGLLPQDITILETNPNYPRIPEIDAANDIVYIDVYIRSSTGGGGGGKGPPR